MWIHGRIELMICTVSSESSQMRIIVCVWSAVATCIPLTSVLCTWSRVASWKCHLATLRCCVGASVLPVPALCGGQSLRKKSCGWSLRCSGAVVERLERRAVPCCFPLTLGGQSPCGSCGQGEPHTAENKEIWWFPVVLVWFKGNGRAMLISQLVLVNWT